MAWAAGAQCPGNLPTAPIVVTSTPYSTSGNTAQACYTNNIGNLSNDVFYMVVLHDCATTISVSLCGSSYDTYLRIYDPTLTVQLAFNDDACGLQSELNNINVAAYDTVFVVVEGFSSQNGSYVMTMTQGLTTPTASFSYPGYYYCQNAPVGPTPTLISGPNPSYSSLGGTASVNPVNGQINLPGSQPGLQQILLTVGSGTCLAYDTADIYIYPTDNGSFVYPPLCPGSTGGTPTVTGLLGGTFGSPSGLSIDPVSGQVDLTSVPFGIYQVSYSTNGICPTTNVQNLYFGDPAFNYPTTTACTDGGSISPVVSGTPGGVFSSTSGLVINANTGVINGAGSAPGSYTVTYDLGGCTATATVTVHERDNASFSYAQSVYCNNVQHPLPIITGTPGGAFSSTTGTPVISGTGEIILDIAAVGVPHVITYGTNGPCPAFSSVTITVLEGDNADFSYPFSTYCLNIPGGPTPTPTVTGLPGGTFAIGGAGANINPATGVIDLTSVTPGTYTVSYTSNGQCPQTEYATLSLTICAGDELVAALPADQPARLFPNPNAGQFTLQTSWTGETNIQVINALGQILYQNSVYLDATQAQYLGIENLPAGNYWLRLQSEQGNMQTLRLTIAKP